MVHKTSWPGNLQNIITLKCRALTKVVAGLNFYNHSILKGSLIWRKKRCKFLKIQRKKILPSVFYNKHRWSLLISNGLLWILKKTNNQSNQKIVDIMSYEIYTHRDTDTLTHMYIYHCFIWLSKPTSVSVLTSKV